GAWWLLQSIPRHPKLVNFPFIRLLFNKVAPDKQVRDAPLWQKIVGTSAVAAAFLAMAQPQFDSSPVVASGNGPVMIVVDNSWDSAKDWPLMRRQIAQVIESAGRQGRSVMMLPTAAENPQGITVGEAQSAEDALRGLAALQPYPWPADRASAMKALEDMEGKTDGASVVWFTSGQADAHVKEFEARLKNIGSLSVMAGAAEDAPHLLTPRPGEELGAIVQRLQPGPAETKLVYASGAKGEVLAQVEVHFAEGDTRGEAIFELPPELRRQVVKQACAVKAMPGPCC
ncbi:MAG: VWA domain-containing protein, partial [Alphaproteobacteria bacterium]|nr:VWA domain-containing protein [Alphaproteobacteria bacterium]